MPGPTNIDTNVTLPEQLADGGCRFPIVAMLLARARLSTIAICCRAVGAEARALLARLWT